MFIKYTSDAVDFIYRKIDTVNVVGNSNTLFEQLIYIQNILPQSISCWGNTSHCTYLFREDISERWAGSIRKKQRNKPAKSIHAIKVNDNIKENLKAIQRSALSIQNSYQK